MHFMISAYHNNSHIRNSTSQIIIKDVRLRWENGKQHTVEETRLAMIY